jgi:RNA polymerase sigma-70 factor (ECF subfamily)
VRIRLPASSSLPAPSSQPFDESFALLFEAQFPRLFRYLDRLSGEPDLAADLAQEAFIRLYRRGVMPERPEVWLVTVALNLFRNTRSTSARRLRLLGRWTQPAEATESSPGARDSERAEPVRAALRQLPPRDREMLLLRAEGYKYREIATALDLNEASIGTLLARAKRAFREIYESFDAS